MCTAWAGVHRGAQHPRPGCAQPAGTAGCRTPKRGVQSPGEHEGHRIPTKLGGTAGGIHPGAQHPQTVCARLSSAQHRSSRSRATSSSPVPTPRPSLGAQGCLVETCTPRPGPGSAPSPLPAPSWAALADELPGNEFCTRHSRFPPPCLDKCWAGAAPAVGSEPLPCWENLLL